MSFITSKYVINILVLNFFCCLEKHCMSYFFIQNKMSFEKVYWLPILTFMVLNSTVVTTFFISRKLGHVTYLLPYISDTGTIPPESCLFGQMLNIISLLLIMVMYVRYRQLRELFSRGEDLDGYNCLNYITLLIGYAACFGCSLVANFQESHLIYVHWFGATLTFGVGSIYMILQSYLSFKIYPIQGSSRRNVIKLMLSLVGFITFLVFWIGAVISLPKFKGEDMTKWKKEDGFFEIHVGSAIAEWICAGCTAFYIFILHYDFKEIKISEPIVILDNHLSNPLHYNRNNRH